jgi:hypothetical protein
MYGLPAFGSENHIRRYLDWGAPAVEVTQVTLPKREALWKFPWPRMGDQANPPLFRIA